MLKTAASLVMALLLAAPASAGVLDAIREKQGEVKAVKAGFTQEKRTELLERPILSKGTFYFKPAKGVRWEYDEAMVVIYDGESVYLHYTELEEAEKVGGVAGYAGPLVFDIDLILKDYDVKAGESEGGYRLTLAPKAQMPFERMEMLFDPDAAFPREIRITEESGDLTVIRFSGVELNAEIPDSMFVFTPPPGVTVRERQFQ